MIHALSTFQILCVVALLAGIFNLCLHRVHERDPPISYSSSLRTPNTESNLNLPSNHITKKPTPPLEDLIKFPKDTKHFLFCIVYIDSPVSPRHSKVFLDSLQHLRKHFSPFEIVILAYHSDSTDAFVNGIYISSARKCDIKSNHGKSLIGINCLIESSFNTVDFLFAHNDIKVNEVTSLYMAVSDFNLNRYFTPNLASSANHLSRTYNNQFCAASSQFVTKNSKILKNIDDFSQDRTYNVRKIEALESLIESDSTPPLNDLVVRTLEQPILLLFPRNAYPSKSNFPDYVLDSSNLWGQRLLDHFHSLSSMLPTIEITQSAYFLGGRNIKSKSPNEHNIGLDGSSYRSTRGDLNRELMQSRLKLVGCPSKCNVTSRQNTSVAQLSEDAYHNLVTIAKKKQGASDALTLLAVSDSTLNSAFNWICWAKSTGLTSYLIVTYSERVWGALNDFNESAYLLVGYQKSATPDHQSDVDLVSNLLANVHIILLQSSMNVLVVSPNLLLTNELSVNLKGDDMCDVIFLSSAIEALVYIKSSEKGLLLMKNVAAYRNAFSSNSKGRFAINSQDYDLYKHVLTAARLHQSDLSMCKFSRGSVINSDFYFKRPEMRFGNVPVAFNLNVKDTQAVNHLNIWNRDNGGTCSYPAVIGAVPSNERENWSLRIRILSSYRDNSFRRLLDSLSDAYYESPVPLIPVDIVIDYPNITLADPDYSYIIERYNNVVKTARSFVWSHGPVNVTVHTYCHGIVFAWLNSRLAPHEVLMVLEDDVEVSKYFYMYIVKAVKHFYVNPVNYNPRLFGLSLQRQYHVVGETIFSYYEPYGPKIIDKVLGGTVYYKYQLVSSWGPLFFPKPWNDFIDWVDSKVRSNSLVPCVPFLYSNHWALKGFVWTPFASRFIFENGLFIIYHHSIDEKALITNHKEPGLHFSNTSKITQGFVPLVDSVSSLENILNQMPQNESNIRLYDFHFRYVSSENSLQLRNRFIDHGLNSCITIARSKRKSNQKSSF